VVEFFFFRKGRLWIFLRKLGNFRGWRGIFVKRMSGFSWNFLR
jgi:hypothetical protein